MRVRNWLGMAIAVVSVTAMAAPAEAQRRGGGRHHRSHDRVSLGDALLGVLLVGGVVAAASERRERARERQREMVYDTPPPTEYQPADQPVESPAPNAARFDGMYDEEAAADACAGAAQYAGQRYARVARVMGIDDVSWNGSSWLVRGNLDLADSWRSGNRKNYGFSCALRRGSDPDVTIAGLAAQ
ncbi:MAG: hypothetical protein V4574_06505 [Pseudomonadota bacterium]